MATFVDGAAGAAVVRLAVCLAASILYIHVGSHWQAVRDAFAAAASLTVAFALLALVIQPITLIYCVLFEVGLFFLRSSDDVLFRLPRWILREQLRLRAVPAFVIAFGLELAALAAASVCLSPHFQVEPPPRFGPAVTRRLGVSSVSALHYPMRGGRVIPVRDARLRVPPQRPIKRSTRD